MSETLELSIGDRVRYRVGKGYGEGRIANIVEGMASIATDKGKIVNRKVSMLTRVESVTEAALETAQ